MLALKGHSAFPPGGTVPTFPPYRLALTLAFILALTGSSLAFDANQFFTPLRMSISIEGSLAHFSDRLNQTGWIQAWNLGARFSLLPFGVLRFARCSGYCDGVLEIEVEPVFERFNTQRQIFAGLGIGARYYLTYFEYGRFVPWVEASIAPGGTDLNIGRKSNQTRLRGPFMNLIQAGAGVSYFVTDRNAVCVGLRAQHISNAGLNGSNVNYSLNTPLGAVLGVSRYFQPQPRKAFATVANSKVCRRFGDA
jgi:hypothetical protein